MERSPTRPTEAELAAAVETLLGCPDLNLDELDEISEEAINRAHDVLARHYETEGGRLGALELEDAATKAAGNWQRFKSFAWFRASELEDSENWAVLYTHHRDSGLLDESNAAIIGATMQAYTDGDDPDVVMERHSHWAVGWIDGFSVRVFRAGKVTPAFTAYHGLSAKIDQYPILSDEDYQRREEAATAANVIDAAWQLKDNFELPDDWQYDVLDWLSRNEPGEVENTSDQGGYPSEEALRRAFAALAYPAAPA